MAMPEKGEKAPTFEGIDQNSRTVRLSDYAGAPVALYFYPKDGTPGCTKQACNLRDNISVLKEAGIEVVGVSPDSVESHEQFSEEHELPFPLIADPDRDIIGAYGVWGTKNLYGNKVIGLKRTTFLIDPDGMIIHVFKRPKTGAHAEEILRKFSSGH